MWKKLLFLILSANCYSQQAVYFPVNGFELSSEDRQLLSSLANDKTNVIKLRGFADKKESVAYNKKRQRHALNLSGNIWPIVVSRTR